MLSGVDMRPFLHRYRSPSRFAAAFLCLVALNVMIHRAEIALSPLSAEAGPISQVNERSSAEPSPLEVAQLPETLARPLFSPTRRNYVPSVPPPPPVAAPSEPVIAAAPLARPSISVQGTRIINGKSAALISDGNGTGEWMEEGEDVSGWRILSVEAGQITLRAEAERFVVNLYEKQEQR